MTTFPFEDEAKRSLRAKCLRALDMASYRILEDPKPIKLKAPVGALEVLVGDIQAEDSSKTRYVFYLRPDAGSPVPAWLQNLAKAALDLENVKLYVVIENVNSKFVAACRSCGAGLLRIEAGEKIELILEPSIESVKNASKLFEKKLSDLNHDLTEAAASHRRAIDVERSRVIELTSGFDGNDRGLHLAIFDAKQEKLTEWTSQISKRIDTAKARNDMVALDSIARDIKGGYEAG